MKTNRLIIVSAVVTGLLAAGMALAATAPTAPATATDKAPVPTTVQNNQAVPAPVASAPDQNEQIPTRDFRNFRYGGGYGMMGAGPVVIGSGRGFGGENVAYRPAREGFRGFGVAGVLCAAITMLLAWTLMAMAIIALYRHLRKKQ